jgi:predicted DNA-binding protein
MGSVRLPASVARRLQIEARRGGMSFADALRMALGAALRRPERLAQFEALGHRAGTVRLGALPMPAELAEWLNVLAQELGVPVNEVIRRAVEVSV